MSDQTSETEKEKKFNEDYYAKLQLCKLCGNVIHIRYEEKHLSKFHRIRPDSSIRKEWQFNKPFLGIIARNERYYDMKLWDRVDVMSFTNTEYQIIGVRQ